MNDPHIDIDEGEEVQIPKAQAEIPKAAPSSKPRPKPRYEDEDEDEDDMPMNFGGSVWDMFSSASQQFRRWQDQMMPGMGRFGDSEFIPNETVQHLRSSQREFLLAWRSLIDSSLERLDKREVREELRREANLTEEGPARRANKIVVEEVED